MKSQNHSPNSVEIIAQAKAGREGVELHIWFSLSDVSAIVRLIISAVLMLRKLFKSTLNNRLHRNLACVIDKSSRGAKLKRAFEELP